MSTSELLALRVALQNAGGEGVTCNGLASHAGGVAILLVGFTLWDKLLQCGSVWPESGFNFYTVSGKMNTHCTTMILFRACGANLILFFEAQGGMGRLKDRDRVLLRKN